MFVCERCVEGSSYKDFIRNHAVSISCSFCNYTDKMQVAALGEDFVAHVLEQIEGEFTDSLDDYLDDEGEPVCETYETCDLLEDVGLRVSDDSLLQFIVDRLPEGDWRRRDPYAPTEDDVNSTGWFAFKTAVEKGGPDAYRTCWNPERSEYDEGYIQVQNVPLMLLHKVRECVGQIPANTHIWRVQVLDENDPPVTPNRFASPEPHQATQPNRMSPAGVSMFYGSADSNTAKVETVGNRSLLGKKVYGVEFETVKEIHVLDLTLVYSEAHHLFYKTKTFPVKAEFLQEFARDLSKPIQRDLTGHIEYVPTQVFTQLIRDEMKTLDGHQIDGIKYTSSKSGKPCYVLFIDHDQCLDSAPLIGKQQLLRYVSGSLKEL